MPATLRIVRPSFRTSPSWSTTNLERAGQQEPSQPRPTAIRQRPHHPRSPRSGYKLSLLSSATREVRTEPLSCVTFRWFCEVGLKDAKWTGVWLVELLLWGMLRLRTTCGLSSHVSSQPKFENEHSSDPRVTVKCVFSRKMLTQPPVVHLG